MHSDTNPAAGAAAAAEPGRRPVADAIRGLIQSGVYLPGQQLRQEQLALAVGVSRVPVREALQVLLAEGIVRHTPNFGYTVARLSGSELTQIYVMRQQVETVLLQSIKPDQVTDELTEGLRACNDRMLELADGPDIAAFQGLNHDFHFRMFAAARMEILEDELRRLWQMSEPYRVAWAGDAARRRMVTSEHRSMIDALAVHDVSRLAALMDVHRGTLAKDMGALLRNPQDHLLRH
jgi:DNA-binding GntR family transcriptional regulator